MAKFMKLYEDEDKKTMPDQSQQARAGQVISLPQSPEASDAWEHYLEKGKTDGYTSQWQQQIDDLTKQIMGRGQFQYDINGDALFQQISDRYTQQGKLAMADAMGRAAALTGGHASSYGQSVGQQAYQANLQGLYDKVPELQKMALDRYNADTKWIQQQLALLQDQEDRDYKKWLTERDFNLGQQNKKYDRLVTLITKTGYEPTDEELEAAGLTRSEYEAYKKLYTDDNGGEKPKYIPPVWGEGYDDDPTKSDETGRVYPSEFSYIKANVAQLIREGRTDALTSYIDQIVDRLSEDQWNEIEAMMNGK